MPTPQFSLSWLASYKVAGRRVAAVAAVVEGAREERDWLRRCFRIFSVVYHDLGVALAGRRVVRDVRVVRLGLDRRRRREVRREAESMSLY
jgi:hypothetical protein